MRAVPSSAMGLRVAAQLPHGANLFVIADQQCRPRPVHRPSRAGRCSHRPTSAADATARLRCSAEEAMGSGCRLAGHLPRGRPGRGSPGSRGTSSLDTKAVPLARQRPATRAHGAPATCGASTRSPRGRRLFSERVFTENDLDDILLCLQEAMKNAVRFSRSDRDFYIGVQVFDHAVRLVVCDSGVGFAQKPLVSVIAAARPDPMADSGEGPLPHDPADGRDRVPVRSWSRGQDGQAPPVLVDGLPRGAREGQQHEGAAGGRIRLALIAFEAASRRVIVKSL